MSALCPSCADESLRWLDYRCPGPIAIHRVGDDTRHGVRQGIRTLETIRSQRALIARHCRTAHQVIDRAAA